MKIARNEIVIKTRDDDLLIMNIETRKCRPIPAENPVEKELPTEPPKKAWSSANFSDSIIKLAKEEFVAGKHKTLGDALTTIINQYPEGYEQYSKEHTKKCQGD
ncbi:MAG: hypothetical protein PHG06_12365 [Parabacteroides sp.]|nr:hypothetical protein [Parabacteroides sp.]